MARIIAVLLFAAQIQNIPPVPYVPSSPRTVTCAASGSSCIVTGTAPNRIITFSSNLADIVYYNDQDAAGTITVAADVGKANNGGRLIIKFLTANAQTLTWTLATASGATVTILAATTGTGKIDNVGLIYDSINSVFECVAVAPGY